MAWEETDDTILMSSSRSAVIKTFEADPSTDQTSTTAAVVYRGQVVEFTSDASHEVRACQTDASVEAIGVALYDGNDGDKIAVVVLGCGAKVRLYASATGAIDEGDIIITDGATGDEGEVKASNTATGRTIIARAASATTASGWFDAYLV